MSQRHLSNPEERSPIRKDFPAAIELFSGNKPCAHSYNGKEIIETIESELTKHNSSIRQIERLNIAYPHKHPFGEELHVNTATVAVSIFEDILSIEAPDVKLVSADAIYEEHHLDRSTDMSSLHALTGKQYYKVDPELQRKPLPFIDPDNQQTEYFIIIDTCIAQGTTIANLINYIEHNNGVVLAASVGRHCGFGMDIVQRPSISEERTDKILLSNSTKNTGRIPELAAEFVKSVTRYISKRTEDKIEALFNQKFRSICSDESRKNQVAETLIDRFENALNRHGNSLHSLTNGECSRLIEAVSSWEGEPGISELLYKLETRPPALR
jgi:hypothetical protein